MPGRSGRLAYDNSNAGYGSPKYAAFRHPAKVRKFPETRGFCLFLYMCTDRLHIHFLCINRSLVKSRDSGIIRGNKKGVLDMARYYRTPDVFIKTRRNSKRLDEDGKIIEDVENTTSHLAPNVEYRLLETIRELTDEQAKKKRKMYRRELTETHVLKMANVSSASKPRYEHILVDLIEMVNKFKLETREKDDDEKDIPSFDKLEDKTKEKTHRFIYGTFDQFSSNMLDYIEKDGVLGNKLNGVHAAYTSAYGSKRIPPDLLMGINEIPAVIVEKYDRVQELMGRYKELRAKL